MIHKIYRILWTKWQKKISEIDRAINSVDYTNTNTIYERLMLSERLNRALEKRNYYRAKVLTRAAKKKWRLIH